METAKAETVELLCSASLRSTVLDVRQVEIEIYARAWFIERLRATAI